MRLLTLAAGLLATAFVLAAPVPKKEAPPPFPMTVGDTREYEWRDGDKTQKGHSDEVTQVEAQKDGSSHVSVRRTSADGKSSTTVICVATTGLTMISETEREYPKPPLLLKLPATVGTKWEENGAKYEVKAEEEVKVPAGTYPTVKVTKTYDERTTTLWFASGVGLVKMAPAGSERVLELKTFKPGK